MSFQGLFGIFRNFRISVWPQRRLKSPSGNVDYFITKPMLGLKILHISINSYLPKKKKKKESKTNKN